MTRYQTHLIEFTGDPERPYEILHSTSCDHPDSCAYDHVAKRVGLDHIAMPPGRYHCSANWNTMEIHGLVPDRWADPPTIEKSWTMGDLREWVGRWGHIPDDMPVTAYVPERPVSWCRTGDPLYTNTLHGLSTEDPEDFE